MRRGEASGMQGDGLPGREGSMCKGPVAGDGGAGTCAPELAASSRELGPCVWSQTEAKEEPGRKFAAGFWLDVADGPHARGYPFP